MKRPAANKQIKFSCRHFDKAIGEIEKARKINMQLRNENRWLKVANKLLKQSNKKLRQK